MTQIKHSSARQPVIVRSKRKLSFAFRVQSHPYSITWSAQVRPDYMLLAS
jgi:hypothetical protein